VLLLRNREDRLVQTTRGALVLIINAKAPRTINPVGITLPHCLL
jgi:hypothetical protein